MFLFIRIIFKLYKNVFVSAFYKRVNFCYWDINLFLFAFCNLSLIDNVDRITDPNYIPIIEDILRARQPTTSIIEYTFLLKDSYFMFVDVSGQRSERRKWINCFENVTSLLFVASLSDYDLTLSKDELKASNTQNLTGN